jgi:hypothetical protein
MQATLYRSLCIWLVETAFSYFISRSHLISLVQFHTRTAIFFVLCLENIIQVQGIQWGILVCNYYVCYTVTVIICTLSSVSRQLEDSVVVEEVSSRSISENRSLGRFSSILYFFFIFLFAAKQLLYLKFLYILYKISLHCCSLIQH